MAKLTASLSHWERWQEAAMRPFGNLLWTLVEVSCRSVWRVLYACRSGGSSGGTDVVRWHRRGDGGTDDTEGCHSVTQCDIVWHCDTVWHCVTHCDTVWHSLVRWWWHWWYWWRWLRRGRPKWLLSRLYSSTTSTRSTSRFACTTPPDFFISSYRPRAGSGP